MSPAGGQSPARFFFLYSTAIARFMLFVSRKIYYRTVCVSIFFFHCWKCLTLALLNTRLFFHRFCTSGSGLWGCVYQKTWWGYPWMTKKVAMFKKKWAYLPIFDKVLGCKLIIERSVNGKCVNVAVKSRYFRDGDRPFCMFSLMPGICLQKLCFEGFGRKWRQKINHGFKPGKSVITMEKDAKIV